MLDFVLCYPPMSLPDSPFMGIALLTAILQKNNFSCRVFDMNVDLYNSAIYEKSEWDTVVSMYGYESKCLIEYDVIKLYVEEYVSKILSLGPRIIGIGVFTKSNVFITKEICKIIRKVSPSTSILIGGMYCEHIGPELLSARLIDFYINGPAENRILDIARNYVENKPGLNNLNKDSVLLEDITVPPDYSQLDLSKYRSKALYIMGSRGCPYKCTFCSVGYRWNKYQLRDIDDIISEMEYHISRGVTRFFFSDSLMNGNMKYFRALCRRLRELYVKHDSTMSLQWFLSIKTKSQMIESDFDLLTGLGLDTVKLGVESGSPDVLRHMMKGYTLPDLFYFMDQLQRVKIRADLFFVTGYPTETEADFELSKQLLQSLVKYNDIINFIRVVACSVEEGTPLYDLGYPLGSSSIGSSRYAIFRDMILSLGFNIRHDKLISSHVKFKATL